MIPAYRYALLTIALALSAGVASAQVTTGTPPFGSFGGGPEVINLGNLNAHLTIPVIHKSGRGLNFTYDLTYDSSIWYPVTSGGTTTWQPVGNWGWRGVTEAETGSTSASSINVTCVQCNQFTCWTATGEIRVLNWVYHDPWGVPHSFSGEADLYTGACPDMPGPSTGFTSQATDGSGYALTVSVSGSSITSTIVTARDGEVVNGPYNSTSGAGSGTDRNGNQITVNSSGVFTDTLGTTALTVVGTAPSPTTFTYTTTSGGSASFTMHYVAKNIKTNFGCSSVNNTTLNSVNLVSDVTLPDGSAYSFLYEDTPGFSGYVTGRLKKITLPTGGTIEYAYSGGGTGINGIFCADGSAATITRTVTPGGIWRFERSLVSGTNWQTLISDPVTPTADQTLINFQKNTSGNFYETERDAYQGSTSGTLLATTYTCYNGSASPCNSTAITLPITRRTEIIQLGSLQCKHDRFWNSFGMPTETDDYDYASGAPGPLLRQTLITYASLGSNLNAFAQTVTVTDGSGNIKSRQDTNYDQYSSFTGSNCITGAPQHDDSGHGCSFTARANATSVTTYTNPSAPSGGITQTFTYDSLGNVRSTQDALNNTTTLAYSPDAWANTACNPSTTSYAYLVSASNALSQTTNFTYFACSGQVASVKDPNNQTTSVSYDSLLRPTQESFPDGGQTTTTYNSLTSIQTQIKMNTTPQYITGTVLLDGLGRTRQTQLNSDTQGVDYTDTTYDAVGRVASVSNPYRSTSDPTYGVTSYQYDALSRVTKVIPPDGSSSANNISATYSSNTTTVTDQAGKKRQSSVDSLGRLTQVTEDPGGLGYVAAYAFDVFGNITNVTQNGGRQRTYTFDALSRLVCESNPEIQIATCPNPDNGSYTAGTIRYGYDNNSNLTGRQAPAPNQTGSATVTTTYQYDALNRLKQKTYSDGTTPTAYYYYDLANPWGSPYGGSYIGRLSEADTIDSTGHYVASRIFVYDPLGRETTNAFCTAVNCSLAGFHTSFSYDLAGDLSSYGTSENGITFSYQYDTAGRPTAVTSSLVDSQHPATLATVDSSLGYYPLGALRKMTLGNGLTQTAALNNGFQPCRVNVNSSGTALGTCADAIPSGNVQDFNYGFNSGSSDNGNVASWTATGQQAFSRTFGYDGLNRLATLNQSSGNATGCSSTFSLSWAYDAWGNRTDQNVTGGTCNPFHATVNSQNQLTGSPYQYDAAGNMIHDASHTYAYDAENRLASVDGGSTARYGYDALGKRVQKTAGSAVTQYIHDLNGQVILETDGNGNGSPIADYIYLAGGLVAEYKNSTTYFAHADHLGSARLLTALNQSVAQNLDYLPFGELNSSDSGITTHEFTGDERDSETGLDHTWFRQYSSSLGRWMQPDPAGLAAVDISNPQSWNRYAYVTNDPLDYIDPYGLFTGQCGPFDDFCSQPPPPTPPCLPPFICLPPGPTGPTDPGHPTGNPGGGGNSGGSTMRATPPQPPCSLRNELTGALDFKVLLGIGGHVGKFDVGAFLYKSLVTGGTGGYAVAQAGKIGGMIDRPTPQGGTITGGAEPAQIFVTWGPSQTDLGTGQTTASKDSKWRLGGAFFGGVELDFDPKAFHDINAQNQACRAMLKKAGFPF